MEITEVKVKLADANDGDRLQAFCSITIDNSFVIRDLKIIQGAKGVFVAMPSRKVMSKCPHCAQKNALNARFCNNCGKNLNPEKNAVKKQNIYTDIAHPINSQCRELIQQKVLEAFNSERQTEEK